VRRHQADDALKEMENLVFSRDQYQKDAEELRVIIRGYVLAIEEVFKAYPEDIFPETTQAERDLIIKQYPGFIDRTSAMMGRHIAKVIQERAAHFARELQEETDNQ
jgi:hypothetical protein